MKNYFLSLLCALSILTAIGCSEGCKSGTGRYDRPTGNYETNVTADAVVVTAEKVREQALETFDLLWTVERQFRAKAWKLSPEIKKYADYTRANAEKWLNSLSTLRNQYQLSRTEENKLKLEGAMEILQKAADEARTYANQANALKPPTQ